MPKKSAEHVSKLERSKIEQHGTSSCLLLYFLCVIRFGTNLGEKQTRSQPIKQDDNMKELLGGTGGGGVGKYLSMKRPANHDPAPAKKKKERGNFSDFSTW